MIPATFSHEGISFRAPQESDLAGITELRNDYTTWTFIKPNGRVLVAFDQVHPFIGVVHLDEYDKMNASIRIALDVARKLRDRGYGRRIFEGLKKYCFRNLNVHRIWLLVLETNKRARKLFTRHGFRVEGKHKEGIFRDGKYLDWVIMSMMEGKYHAVKS